MKKEIKARIIEYLQLETNYAIILNGNYGIGKTHFIKNELFPDIENLSIQDSKNNEKFIPIFVSLFGVENIADLQGQIFLELFPVLNKRGVKIVAGLGNGILKYFNNNLNDLISDTGALESSFKDYKRIFICIDDIDRKGDNLSIQEVFGFVNNLVENFGAKILLVANEDKLREGAKSDTNLYDLLREKVVGISMNFKTDLNSTFNEIIHSKYKKSYPIYYEFLENNKKEITRVISLNNDNLRSLLFFLEHFKIIYKNLESLLNKEKDYESSKEEIFSKVLSFSLPIAFEYKSGRLNPRNFEEIRQIYTNGFFDISSFLGEQDGNDKKTKTYKECYRDRYLKRTDEIIYFDSVFNYIIGEYSLNMDNLKKEINSAYAIAKSKIPRKELILQELSYWECLNLSYKEYRRLTNEMLELADKAKYNLDQYPTIFHYASRFNNLLNFDLQKLVERLKKGISKGDFEYQDKLHFKLNISSGSEYYQELKEVGDFCLQKNRALENVNKSKEISKLFALMRTDIKAFLESITDKNKIYRFSPIFIQPDFVDFWKDLKNFPNSDIVEFAYVLKQRYRRQIYPELLPEKEFLLKLQNKSASHIKMSTTRKLDKVSFDFLQKTITGLIPNFEE